MLASAASEAQLVQDGGHLGLVLEVEERVDHGVAYEMNSFVRDAFVTQVPQPTFFRHKEQIGDMVREHPVDLLRHPPVEAA